MSIQSYKELKVWQKSMEVAEKIYRLTQKMPKEELYSLTNQMRRAAVSIPSNIAEGQGRNSTKEFIQFLSIANGSTSELETQLHLSVRIGYLANTDIEEIMALLEEISKMLKGLIKKLKLVISEKSNH